MIINYLVVLALITIGSFSLASAICLSLMLTPLVGRWYYRFGMKTEPAELAEPRQLRELEAIDDVITLSPEDWREI